MRNSPVWHEPANLLAAVRQVERRDFSTYRVNGPLSRWPIGAVLRLKGVSEAPEFPSHGGRRAEFAEGTSFVHSLGPAALGAVRWARFSLLPFSIVGLFVSYLFARDLYGVPAGLLAATLWALSPTTLGSASVALPDASAAALGLAGAYGYWKWLQEGGWAAAISAGGLLGAAAATKSTLLVALALVPAIYPFRRRRTMGAGAVPLLQLAATAVVAVATIHAAYAFQGSGSPLGSLRFSSQLFGGETDAAATKDGAQRRFAAGWLDGMPTPLPPQYLLGVDEQTADFENGMWGYLAGRWSREGWLCYYIAAFAVKESAVVLALLALRIAVAALSHCGARDEVVVVGFWAALALLVSSQTGVNKHYRYLLPAIPFFYVWISGVLRHPRLRRQSWTILTVAAAGLGGAVAAVHPHELSFFNMLAGGPTRGAHYLLGSNLDWSQDFLHLRDWMDRNPAARPIRLYCDVPYDPVEMGILERGAVDSDAAAANATRRRSEWLAISANRLFSRHGELREWRNRAPYDRVGYSIWIYRLDFESSGVRSE